MANQFNAKIRFEPVVWFAVDNDTGWFCIVDDRARMARWFVFEPSGTVAKSGETKTTSAARAACRRVLANQPTKKT